MSNDLKVKGPIEIKDNSAERVAFDLMARISTAENYSETHPKLAENKRHYYLELYSQCLDAVKDRGAPSLSDLSK
ncbi:hypothetical protein [Psychrobacter sp. 16-MNA-CIBAN-0192]|uniref:hypothetical protein n=1 Tax=Psychrobacter sp. 16-MNA-CIBAN-0192 TaxID=3140448 RepID=UPI00332B71E8